MSDSTGHPDEGYVKFRLEWKQEPVDIPSEVFQRLETWRDRLYAAGAIGAYSNGIGFGNISARTARDTQSNGCVRFFITGSATGNYEHLSPTHYALVTSYSLEGNTLVCRGGTKASSESLSHAAIYEAVPSAAAVIHVHHRRLWETHRGALPTTPESIEYGTPEMALALKALAADIAGGGVESKSRRGEERSADLSADSPAEPRASIRRRSSLSDPTATGIIVMGGHEEGVIAFGKTLDDAGEALTELIVAL